MARGKQLAPSGMTPLQIEFCHLYAAGPNAGNGAACIREAGYQVGSDGAAAAMASELLTREDVRMYLGLLYAERRAGRILQSRPWDALLPVAQALQLEAVEAGRDALAFIRNDEKLEIGEEDREKRGGLDAAKVSGPLVNLIKSGLEAAQQIEAYALGKPVTRTEQGNPGAFKEQGLRETVGEIRETMELLKAAGMEGFLLPGTDELVIAPPPQKRVGAPRKEKGKKKENRKGKENALEAPKRNPSPAPKRDVQDNGADESETTGAATE